MIAVVRILIIPILCVGTAFAIQEVAPQLSYVTNVKRAMSLLNTTTRYQLSKRMVSAHGLLSNDVFPEPLLSNVMQVTEPNNNSCSSDLSTIFVGIEKREYWALQWLDALAKPPPGFTGGAIYWTGSYELCLNLSWTSNPDNVIKGKYCGAVIELPTGGGPEALPQLQPSLHFGLCIPQACDETYLFDSVAEGLSRLSFNLSRQLSFCHEDRVNQWEDSWFIAAVVFALLLVVMVTTGSLLDAVIYTRWRRDRVSYQRLRDDSVHQSHGQDGIHVVGGVDNDRGADNGPVLPFADYQNLEEVQAVESLSFREFRSDLLSSHKCQYVLAAFSLPYNAGKLWNVCDGKTRSAKPVTDAPRPVWYQHHPLDVFDGVRFITMIWIIFGHSLIFSLAAVNNTLLYVVKVIHRWTFQVIVSGTLSVDTFFFMSGALNAYLVAPRLNSASNGWLIQVQFWCLYVLHRFIRLTPVYLVVMVLYTGLYPYLYDGPLYPYQRPDLTDTTWCRAHGWVTYLNNLVYPTEMCMGWTWYLANEMQFSIVLAPIFLSLRHRHRGLGIAYAVFLIASGIAITYTVSYVNNFLPGNLSIGYFEDLYVKPFTHWPCYAIGLLLGDLLEGPPVRLLRLSKAKRLALTLSGLCLSSVLCLATVYGLYGVTSGEVPMLTRSVAALYNAVHRPVFILGVAIVVQLCALDWTPWLHYLLSWSAFKPLARLTYVAYLVHPIVMLFCTQALQMPLLINNLSWILTFFSFLVVSYASAFILSMAVEVPLMSLEKLIFPL